MILTILFVVTLVLMGGFIVGGIRKHAEHKRLYGVSKKELESYSWPARTLVKEYYDLPAESRPHVNIVRVVKALDTKYKDKKIDLHFSERRWAPGGDVTKYGWNIKHCYRKTCTMGEYHDLHNSINEVAVAHAEQAHALEMAGIAGDLDGVYELTVAMRQERDLINDVTKELTK